MNISRFFGSTNREALRQVRLALGPDALIVSNRRVNGGVEILATDPTAIPETAAMSGGPAVAPDPAMPVAPSVAGLRSGAVPAAAMPPPSTPARMAAEARPSLPGEPADVMSAIGAMRGALESRIDELLWGNQLRRAPQAVSLFQTLLGFGFSTALVRAMLKRLPEDLSQKAAFDWARQELVKHLPVLSDEDSLWQPGAAVALVGPTGVGKTTTIAKLAARCLKRVGQDGLVLITTDTYRIGAHEQLKIYAQMLRVPIHVVRDAGELRQVVQGIGPRQIILIDNVGVSQRDRYVTHQAAMLAGAGRPVSRLLALNAASQGDTLDEVARSYAGDGGSPLRGCIITKVDEASRFGSALDTAIRYRLPVHYVSNGQKVPENLLFLKAGDLVDHAMAQASRSRALYAPTEADFAALMAHGEAADKARAGASGEERRRKLLPALLSAVGTVAGSATSAAMAEASDYIDDHLACAEAFAGWRAAQGHAGPDAEPLTAASLLRAASRDAAENLYPYLIACHDQVGFRSAGGSRIALTAGVLLSDTGQALVSPAQQLRLPDGWQSSCGATAALAPAAGEALLHQLRHLDRARGGLSLVHLFDSASASVWRHCSQASLPWLAMVPGTTRLWEEDGATTAAALAKRLDHRPLSEVPGRIALRQLAGLAPRDVAVWAASARVTHRQRGQADLPLEIVSLRIVQRHDGLLLKHCYAVRDPRLAPEGLNHDILDTVAGWMLLRGEAKPVMRHAVAAWKLLDASFAADDLRRAAVAVQMGFAAWELAQSAGASSVRDAACVLMGKPATSVASAAGGLSRVFAVKEMMGE